MTPSLLTVHCADTPSGRDVKLETIRDWHMKERGWSDIGYHYVIELDGQIRSGRPIDRQGAHVEGANKDNLGICLVGTDKFTGPQWMSLLGLIRACQNRWKISFDAICVHNEFASAKKQGKTCPNFSKDTLARFLMTESLNTVSNHLLATGGPA